MRALDAAGVTELMLAARGTELEHPIVIAVAPACAAASCSDSAGATSILTAPGCPCGDRSRPSKA